MFPLRANKEYIAILHLAAKESENLTEAAIRHLLTAELPLGEENVKRFISQSHQIPQVTDVAINELSLQAYDALLSCCEEVAVHDKRSQSSLHAYLEELCLTTVRRRYAETAQKARKDSWGYETYLLEVLQEESEARKNRTINN